MTSYKSDVEAIDAFVGKYRILTDEIGKVIVGQDDVIKSVLICIFSKGHALLVGVPGLAKTLLVNTISRSLGLTYSRIQFTPDLMPSDILGTEILDENRRFRFMKGPVFANIILADEINRTPPKTQSALLEAMQEKAVTVAGESHKLVEPFFVLATQNPIEQEGTYPLPEAQLDRFMFNIWLDYPTFEQEIDVVKNTTTEKQAEPQVVLSGEEIIYFQNLVRRIPVADNVYQYAVKVASRTRPGTAMAHEWADKYLTWGAGPRASQYLIIGAKCHAAMNGKYSPDIEDVQSVATSILRHRIVRNYKAEAEGITVKKIVEEILK
ncbi:MAG: AAA family ATPase [Bacteroidales bacterium]|nr:AAA family ATPase [Bacteroidales bacterium]MBK9356963.1 AAA family ATPase [Bacteroidales bacterium]